MKVKLEISGAKKPGLFFQFFQKKIGEYQEPTRAGTPKGDPIGFPAKKYVATLMVLGEGNLKDLADDLKVSYEVLRKWNVEPAFKKQVTKHIDEFKKVFVDYITEKWDRAPERKKGTSVVPFHIEPVVIMPMVKDALQWEPAYSKVLEDEILKEMTVRVKDKLDLTFPFMEVLNFWNLSHMKTQKDLERTMLLIVNRKLKMSTLMQDVLINELSDIFKKDVITKEDRTHGLQALEYLDFLLKNLESALKLGE